MEERIVSDSRITRSISRSVSRREVVTGAVVTAGAALAAKGLFSGGAPNAAASPAAPLAGSPILAWPGQAPVFDTEAPTPSIRVNFNVTYNVVGTGQRNASVTVEVPITVSADDMNSRI